MAGAEHEADGGGRSVPHRFAEDPGVGRRDRRAVELRATGKPVECKSVARSGRRCSALPSSPIRGRAIPTSVSTPARQVQRGRAREGQVPERGVVEVKSAQEDTQATVVRDQVSRYWARYRLVLVSNLREFRPDRSGLCGRRNRARIVSSRWQR